MGYISSGGVRLGLEDIGVILFWGRRVVGFRFEWLSDNFEEGIRFI